MTRFARAKGSKSSNERAPEDGTPWEVMKDQLLKAKQENEYSKKRQEAEQQRIENYENFLKEQKILKRKATWCDFPEAVNKKKPDLSESQPKKAETNVLGIKLGKDTNNDTSKELKSKKKKKHKIDNSNQSDLAEKKNGDNDLSKPPKTKEKLKHSIENSTANELTVIGLEGAPTSSEKSLKKKTKKKSKQVYPDNNSKEVNQPVVSNNIDTPTTSENNHNETPSKSKKNKKKKNKGQHQSKLEASPNTTKLTNNNSSKFNDTNSKPNGSSIKNKNKKLVNGLPNRRKPLNDNSFQLIINGKEVNLVRFDGFPIMEKDADRLHDLRNNMIKKGIPKSEIQRTMKLERRRAEKALARLKRDVCYNCRKGGHNLSDCPDLKSKIPGVDAADGICFKCGSTEHKQFECKVQRDKEFRFASCFICKEQGHIARQCPDNPKGLYPNGGGCKLCGDVTHLKKDCPTVQDKREGKSIKLNTLDNADNLEDIDQVQTVKLQEKTKAPKKIKF